MMFKNCLVVACLLCVACSPPKEKIPPTQNMEQSNSKLVIYQMMTRLFGNKKELNKPYGTIDENGVGKFNDITDKALEGIKELGVTHVWYTGVIEHACLTDYTKFGIPLDDADVVKGRAGSPYAIKDYYDVNPDLAVNVPDRMKEFEALVSRTHAHDLKVIIDFVPNHVARAYKSDARPAGVHDLGEDDDKSVSFKPDNNFYYLLGEEFKVPEGYVPLGVDSFPTKDGKFYEVPAKVTGNDQFTASPGINEWFDAVKLNYGVDIQNGRSTHFDPIPDTWLKMRDVLVYWTKKNVDGFRCDMVGMVPVEFWNWVIPHVKSINPQIIFIAEIYEPDQYRNYLTQGRFDYLYDKVLLYDTLRGLMNHQRQSADIVKVQKGLSDINGRLLHFMENHDEQRIASKFFAGDPWRAIPPMVVSATIDKGPVMIYFGQEVGEPGNGIEGFQGDDGRTTIYDYWGVPEHQKWMNNGLFNGDSLSQSQKELRTFYSSLLSLCKSEAFTRGDYYDLTDFNISKGNINQEVNAFIRVSNAEKYLVITNFSAKPLSIRIEIPSDIVGKISLQKDQVYLLSEKLWKQTNVSMTELAVPIELPANYAYIFKMNLNQ